MKLYKKVTSMYAPLDDQGRITGMDPIESAHFEEASDDEVYSRIKRLEDDVRMIFMRLPADGRTGFNNPEHQGKARDMVNESVGTMTGPPVQFQYENYKGEKKLRSVTPIAIKYGHYGWENKKLETDTTKCKSWFMVAYDQDKKGIRHFLLGGIKNIIVDDAVRVPVKDEDREEGVPGACRDVTPLKPVVDIPIGPGGYVCTCGHLKSLHEEDGCLAVMHNYGVCPCTGFQAIRQTDKKLDEVKKALKQKDLMLEVAGENIKELERFRTEVCDIFRLSDTCSNEQLLRNIMEFNEERKNTHARICNLLDGLILLTGKVPLSSPDEEAEAVYQNVEKCIDELKKAHRVAEEELNAKLAGERADRALFAASVRNSLDDTRAALAIGFAELKHDVPAEMPLGKQVQRMTELFCKKVDQYKALRKNLQSILGFNNSRPDNHYLEEVGRNKSDLQKSHTELCAAHKLIADACTAAGVTKTAELVAAIQSLQQTWREHDELKTRYVELGVRTSVMAETLRTIQDGSLREHYDSLRTKYDELQHEYKRLSLELDALKKQYSYTQEALKMAHDQLATLRSAVRGLVND